MAGAFPLYNIAPQPLGGSQDDTANVQTAIDATPDGCLLVFPDGGAVYNVGRLKIYHRTALRLATFARADLASLDRSGCTLKFNGIQGDVGAIDINSSHRCTIEGFRIDLSGATYPNCGVSVDQWDDPNPPNTLPKTTTTQTLLKDLIIACPGKAASGCNGINVSMMSRTNADFTRVRGCNISSYNNTKGWGDGIVSGPSYNQKGMVVEDCSVSWAVDAFHIMNGVMHISDCFGTGNQCDLKVDSTPGPVTMQRCRFEMSGRACNTNILQDSEVLLRHCEWGNLGQGWGNVQTYALQMQSQYSRVDGCVFGAAPDGGAPPAIMHFPVSGIGIQRLWMTNTRCSKIQDNTGNCFKTSIQENNEFRPY
jgi:hypothetical protein